MGGGDLNQKKSWHPSTGKNIERVQKAEIRDAKEKQRIAELKREIDEERDQEKLIKIGKESGVLKNDDVKLEWMYRGPQALVNREEYLLGKTVDKSFELFQQGESSSQRPNMINAIEYDCTPVSIFSRGGGKGQVDIERKLQEDPLVQIKKQERESLKKIVTNPIKMKQLQKLAEVNNPKSKKHKSEEKREDLSESELDKLLLQKLNKIEKLKSRDSRDDDRQKHKKSKHRSRSRSRSPPSSRHHRSRSRSPPPSRHRNNRRSPTPPPPHNRSKPYNNNRSTDQLKISTKPPTKTKLSSEEMERRRQEMLCNAKWRDEQRSSRVKRNNELERKVKEKEEKNRDPEFIRKQFARAAETSTVESRVKSNIYNIQRSNKSMDQNFARK